MTEDQIELPDEPVTSPKQITVYVTVCSLVCISKHSLAAFRINKSDRSRSRQTC